jgi:NAD(P)-dependent dehydrogenase (short-subunit alcohol dehydrogenase family)
MNKQTIVLITGATAGIGRHVALDLARKGFWVIASGRRLEALEALLDEAQGYRLNTVELDVTDAASITRAVEEVDAITGGRGVDVLINNAGYGMAAPIIETSDDDLRRQYDTNVFGLMAVTRAFVPRMLERGRGRIINVSSVGGRVTLPFFGAYNSTKYAVESLSDALRRELAAFGIQVALIEPGPIRSDFSGKTMSFVEKYASESSPYAAVYARARQIRELSDARSAGPECVARAIEHAIVARRARPRYVMPGSSRLFVWVAGWLPTRWLDWAFQRVLGVRRGARPALPEASAGPETPSAAQNA